MRRNLSIPGVVLIGTALALLLKGQAIVPIIIPVILLGIGVPFMIIGFRRRE